MIGVILLIGVMGAGSSGSGASQAVETVNEINQMRAGVKILGYSHDFAGINNDVMEVGGVMPQELIAGAVGAGNDVDAWGGSAGVGDYCYGYANTPCYEMWFFNVPRAACVALASQVAIPAEMAPLVGYAIDISGVGYGQAGQPLTPTQAAAACVGNNDLAWFFND